MLTTMETANSTVGPFFAQPSLAPSAIAQTASSIPAAISTIQPIGSSPALARTTVRLCERRALVRRVSRSGGADARKGTIVVRLCEHGRMTTHDEIENRRRQIAEAALR